MRTDTEVSGIIMVGSLQYRHGVIFDVIMSSYMLMLDIYLLDINAASVALKGKDNSVRF
jgi:hypothetical protein